MRVLANVNAYGSDVALVTFTAPGVDVLPWADSSRTVVEAQARYRWNRDAPRQWSRIHRRAAQRVRRRHGPWSLVAYAWEYQKRGVLHMHLILPMGTAQERKASNAYVRELDALRRSYGFGYVDRGRYQGKRRRTLEVAPAGRAAAYVSKYLTGSGHGKASLTETVLAEDVPRLVVYVNRRLTGVTGVTMRNLRRRRAAHMIARHTGASFASVLECLLGFTPTVQLLVGNVDPVVSEMLSRAGPAERDALLASL